MSAPPGVSTSLLHYLNTLNMKAFLAVALVCTLSLVAAEYGHHEEEIHYPDHHPEYKFQYSVHDPHTHDIKSHEETRHGDVVKGYYKLKEADGSTRVVHYTADKHSGFNAVVTKDGHQVHPAPEHSEHGYY